MTILKAIGSSIYFSYVCCNLTRKLIGHVKDAKVAKPANEMIKPEIKSAVKKIEEPKGTKGS